LLISWRRGRWLSIAFDLAGTTAGGVSDGTQFSCVKYSIERALLHTAMAFVSYGFVLVRVRVRVERARGADSSREGKGG
jgi:hypothetical protein